MYDLSIRSGSRPTQWLSSNLQTMNTRFNNTALRTKNPFASDDMRRIGKSLSGQKLGYDKPEPVGKTPRGMSDKDPFDKIPKAAGNAPKGENGHFDKDLEKFPVKETGRKIAAYGQFKSQQKYGGVPTFEQLRKEREVNQFDMFTGKDRYAKELLEADPVVDGNAGGGEGDTAAEIAQMMLNDFNAERQGGGSGTKERGRHRFPSPPPPPPVPENDSAYYTPSSGVLNSVTGGGGGDIQQFDNATDAFLFIEAEGRRKAGERWRQNKEAAATVIQKRFRDKKAKQATGGGGGGLNRSSSEESLDSRLIGVRKDKPTTRNKTTDPQSTPPQPKAPPQQPSAPTKKKKDKPKALTPAKKAKKPSKQLSANMRRRIILEKGRSARSDDDMSTASSPPASPVQMATSPTTSPRRSAPKRKTTNDNESASDMEVDDPEVAELMDEVAIKFGVDGKGVRVITGDFPTAAKIRNVLKDDQYLELLNEARSHFGELDPADLLKHTKSGRLTKQTLKNMLGKPKSPPSSPVRLLGSDSSGGAAIQLRTPQSPPKAPTPASSPAKAGTVTRDDDSIANETFGKMKTTREEVMTAFAQVGLDAATATTAQVTKAYKKLLVPLHPDRGGDKDKFQKFNRMWQLAKDYIHKYNLISKQYKQA